LTILTESLLGIYAIVMRMKENKILFDSLVSVQIQNAELQIMKFTACLITVRRSLHTQHNEVEDSWNR